MTTKELYKRMRPKKLSELVGSEGTVRALQTMIDQKRVPHTLLLHGPSGCGKTTIARILRRALGCHPRDFREFNCSDFRGIDTIREIARTMTTAPGFGRSRVILLDEVHQMSKDAQNAALKILEDTPKHVWFVLCTTDPQKLIKTIRTRGTPLPVQLLTAEQATGLVQDVARRAGIKLTKDNAEQIADACEGSARAALVILDKIANLPAKDRASAIARVGEEQREAIELCRALFAKAPTWAQVAAVVKDLQAHDPESLRHAVLGYASSVVLGAKSQSPWSDRAYSVILAFERSFYDSKRAGLVRACYEALHAK